MKKIMLFFLLIASLSPAIKAQKVINDENAEKRTTDSFHGINVANGIKLILTESAAEEVAVSARTTDYRDKIVTEVENGILKIYYDRKLSINLKKENRELKAYVSYKTLDYLNANTGASVEIDGTLKAASLKIKANTGAVIKGIVQADALDVDQDTGSIITLTGTTGSLEVVGDTGSMFRGIDLSTGSCKAKASTGAGVYITVQKELSVKADTGGYIKYKGDAGVHEIRTNTGGSVSKI